MAIFIYKARDAKNKLKKGKVVAANQIDAVKVLKKKKLAVVSLKDFTNSIEFKITSFLAPIKGKDLVVFSRQFSIMMMANVPIIESLKIIV
jgi:type IV pilus assembly protein PilC